MRRIDTYRMHGEIHSIEVRELKNAVKEFGGEIHFGFDYTGEFASGTERPFVLVNPSKLNYPQDVFINAIKIDKNNRMDILAETKDGYEFSLNTDDIEFGHVSFITDLIPDLDKKKEEHKNSLILETAVFMAWDMFNTMYHPDKGWGQFEVCHEIIRLAKEFENTRKFKVTDDDYDEGRYFHKLMGFEYKYLKEFNEKIE